MNRKKVLDDLHLTDIYQYHAKNKSNIKKLPNIVIIIDEYSGIMKEFSKEFEHNITKILHKGYKYGVYLVFSTSFQDESILPLSLKIWISNYIIFRTRIKLYKNQNTENLLCGEMLYVKSRSNNRYIKLDYLDGEYIWKKTQHIKQKYLRDI